MIGGIQIGQSDRVTPQEEYKGRDRPQSSLRIRN